MIPEPNIPRELVAKAYHSPNGELTWPRADAPKAVEALARAGYALMGGEAWIIRPDGSIYGQLPDAKGGWGVYAWGSGFSWAKGSDRWRDFCMRCARHTLAMLRDFEIRVLRDVRPDLQPHVWFNLTWTTWPEWERDHGNWAPWDALIDKGQPAFPEAESQ